MQGVSIILTISPVADNYKPPTRHVTPMLRISLSLISSNLAIYRVMTRINNCNNLSANTFTRLRVPQWTSVLLKVFSLVTIDI